MEWKHHYSLLTSVVVLITIIVFCPGFEIWYVVPPVLAGIGGSTIIIKLGKRHPKSPEMIRAEEELEIAKKRWELDKKIRNEGIPSLRSLGLVFVLALLGLLAYIHLSQPNAIDGVRDVLNLLDEILN